MNPSLLLPLLLAGTTPDLPPKPTKLGLCVACHGEEGRSRTSAAPHIGGQNEAYLVWALTQYRQGRREGDVMSAVAGSLNAQDVEALAAWYARQRWPAAATASQ